MRMHSYSVEPPVREKVAIYLFIFSIFLAWILNKVVDAIGLNFPWWLNAPSVGGIYALLFKIYNNYLWKRLPNFLLAVPNLNGVWKGHVKSSFTNFKEIPITLKIVQTWTKILIIGDTELSKSYSLFAALLIDNPEEVMLIYDYINQPRPNAKETMHAHRGTVHLVLDKEKEVLKGEYYTGRDRLNYGEIFLTRTKSNKYG